MEITGKKNYIRFSRVMISVLMCFSSVHHTDRDDRPSKVSATKGLLVAHSLDFFFLTR